VHTVVSPRASWIVSESVRVAPPSVTCASHSQVWSRSATAFTYGVHVIAVQTQQVDVGVDAHLAARIATHRDHAELARPFAARVEVVRLGELEQAPHQPVDQVGVRLVHVATRRAGGVPRAQLFAGRGEIAARRERHLARALVEP